MPDPVSRQDTANVDADRMWSIDMGEHRIVVYADSYDEAVVELDMWCRENGVERTGADFLRGRLHDAVQS